MPEPNSDPASASAAERAPQQTPPPRMDELATLPVFFKLKGKRAVVAGAGGASLWKTELLAAAGASVCVYAPSFGDDFRLLAERVSSSSLTLISRGWQDSDLAEAAIAVGGMTDVAEAAAFAAAARQAGVPVNVIDRPQFCDFQFGSIVNRSPLVVAISTDGAAPVFGQAVRSRIEALLPQGFKRWAEAAKAWRRLGNRLGDDIANRRRFWERFTERAMLNAERVPGDSDLDELLAAATASTDTSAQGFVSLVGAGPGDPELLTLRAVRALRSADVVLYDDLVTAAILDFARREARRMLVGKTGYGPACKQTEINSLMIDLARQGHRVVRLKSGDPMIFGRGGEEIGELEKAGIAFDVIPGISGAQAAAARLKVSLTHRDHAKRLQYVTGHSRQGRLPETLDWRALADPCATTVVYMALRTFEELRDKVLAEGISPDTPAYALVNISRDGEEQVVKSTLAELPAALAARQQAGEMNGPCLVMYGEALRSARAAGAGGLDASTTELSKIV